MSSPTLKEPLTHTASLPPPVCPYKEGRAVLGKMLADVCRGWSGGPGGRLAPPGVTFMDLKRRLLALLHAE